MPCTDRMPSFQCSERVFPPRPHDVVARPPGVVGPDLEAGGEDDAVHLVLLPGGDDTLGRDPLDTLSVGVDERHGVQVEGLEVFVVETGSLAELPVPRLQRLRRRCVSDDRIDA